MVLASVMVLARVVVLACVIVLARVMVLARVRRYGAKDEVKQTRRSKSRRQLEVRTLDF